MIDLAAERKAALERQTVRAPFVAPQRSVLADGVLPLHPPPPKRQGRPHQFDRGSLKVRYLRLVAEEPGVTYSMAYARLEPPCSEDHFKKLAAKWRREEELPKNSTSRKPSLLENRRPPRPLVDRTPKPEEPRMSQTAEARTITNEIAAEPDLEAIEALARKNVAAALSSDQLRAAPVVVGQIATRTSVELHSEAGHYRAVEAGDQVEIYISLRVPREQGLLLYPEAAQIISPDFFGLVR